MSPTYVGVQTAQLLKYTAAFITLVGGTILSFTAQGVYSLGKIEERYVGHIFVTFYKIKVIDIIH